MFTQFSFKSIAISVSAASILAACAVFGETPFREEVASRIASPAWLVKREIHSAPFILTAYERMHERGHPANLYIEGDGMGELLAETIFYDPEPENPIALHLASRDNAINLAYIARPCQYSGLTNIEEDCDSDTWKATDAFGPAVISAYNKALDKMKQRYGITGFNFIGHDSGATLAALLAASRSDTRSLRTVAGEFHLDALASHADMLRTIPQHHFAGGQDTLNPPEEIHSYLQLVGSSECIDTTFIQENAHYAGWVDKWPELLKEKLPLCIAPTAPAFVPIEKPEPIFYPRMSGDKK